VFGLAENGRYVNSVKTVTPTACFKIPVSALTEMFVRDGKRSATRRDSVTSAEWCALLARGKR